MLKNPNEQASRTGDDAGEPKSTRIVSPAVKVLFAEKVNLFIVVEAVGI